MLRFWNGDVLNGMDGVLEAIYLALGQRTAPSPGTLKRQRATGDGNRARRPLPKGRGKAAAREKATTKK